jgi:hypothetical protein
MSLAETYYPNVKPLYNYKGEICKSCNCNDCPYLQRCLNTSGRVRGWIVTEHLGNGASPGSTTGAKGTTKTNAAGEQASALIKFAKSIDTNNNNDLVKFIKFPVLGMLLANPQTALTLGIPALVISEIVEYSKKSDSSITYKLTTDPVFKENVKKVVNKVIKVGENVLSPIVTPIKTGLTLIEMLPYVVIGILAIAAIYVVKMK